MNNTTTKRNLALAAVFVAATLVVGTLATTTIATQQSTAFAYSQKKKGDDNSRNGNTITALKCQNKGSASGFDTTVDQECENLICTHPGDNATCVQEGVGTPTTTPTPKPTTTTLLVKKVCFQADSTPCPSEPRFTFPITVTDDNPKPSTFSLANGDSQLVILGPGTYKVSEAHPTIFTVTFSGDCNANGDGTIAAGQHKTCTITNTQEPF
jgi:hypothetical protein